MYSANNNLVGPKAAKTKIEKIAAFANFPQ
jgi:hypothetical protein